MPPKRKVSKEWEPQIWDNELDAIMLNSFRCIKHGKETEIRLSPIRDFVIKLLAQAREEEYRQGYLVGYLESAMAHANEQSRN